MTDTPFGVQEGDRIRLLAMPDDPDPIEFGSKGIVTGIRQHSGLFKAGPWWQIDVDWEDGRSLMLSVPPDKFDIVRADKCKHCQQDIWPTGLDEDGAEWHNAEGEVVCSTLGDEAGQPHEPMTVDDEVRGTLDLMQSVAERTRDNPPDLAAGLEDTRDEVLRPDHRGGAGMKGDPIMVECDNCGWGHRWIPSEVEQEMESLKARITELEEDLELARAASDPGEPMLGGVR